jgi:hypothetical protein
MDNKVLCGEETPLPRPDIDLDRWRRHRSLQRARIRIPLICLSSISARC